MPLSRVVHENGNITVRSGERLTIENADELRQVLIESFGQSGHVTICFDPALELDITALQIICSACKTAARNNSVFVYEGALPEGLAALVTTCGAERHSACKYNNDSTCIWFGGMS